MQPPTPGMPAPAALQRAAALALLALSVHDTRPWLFESRADRVVIRADRSRQLTVLDPTGRELVQSVGAALFNIRVGCAAAGLAAEVARFPEPDDADLIAVVRPGAPDPDPALARLADAVGVRRPDRSAFVAAPVPDGVLRRLADGAAAEGALLVPVLHETHRRLLARLTQQADRIQQADPGHRAELQRRPDPRHDELPDPGSVPVDGTLLVLATASDDPLGWLRCGEAMQRVLLELAALGWVACPSPQLVEVPITRTQLRSALTWDAHPQLLLYVGRAEPAAATRRRAVDEVVSTT